MSNGGTSDRAILIPELGLAYVSSANGLVRGVMSGPGFEVWSHDLKRRLTWIAPYGVPDGGGRRSDPIRFRVVMPGHVGGAAGQVKVDLTSVGPGGKEVFGPGTLDGEEFPPTSLRGAAGREYDPIVNQVTTTVQPWGTTLTVERDDYGRDLLIVEAEGTPDESSLSYEYNDYGQKTSETNANGHATEYIYNDNGYLESSTVDPSGLGLVTRYETDERGNVTAMIDPRGVRFEYVYNEVDWLVEERIATTGSSDGAPALNYVITYLYDENGNAPR